MKEFPAASLGRPGTFSASTAAGTGRQDGNAERGSQDSNLESPVLETAELRRSVIAAPHQRAKSRPILQQGEWPGE